MYTREHLIISLCDLLERMGLPSEALSPLLNEYSYRKGVEEEYAWEDMRDSFRYVVSPGDKDAY